MKTRARVDSNKSIAPQMPSVLFAFGCKRFYLIEMPGVMCKPAVNKHVSKSVSKPAVGKSISKHVTKSVNKPAVSKHVTKSVGKSINKPIGKSVN